MNCGGLNPGPLESLGPLLQLNWRRTNDRNCPTASGQGIKKSQ